MQNPPRACERIESYIIEFESLEDVNRVRTRFQEDGIDAAMQLAVQLKYAHMRAKESKKKAA